MLQKIVVFTNLEDSDSRLILCGVRLAAIFKKELCLFYQAGGAFHSGEIDKKLNEYRQLLLNDLPWLPVSVLVAAFRGERLAVLLADEHEAIMLVAGASRFSKLSASLLASPIPYLFIDETQPFISDFRKIVFPVDLRRQNKDAMKWVVFFGKHNKSEIVAIGANDKLKHNRQEVAKLMSSLKNILIKSGISHFIYRGSRNSLAIHKEGLEAARQFNASLLILLGSSSVTLLDLVLGLPEKKIICRAGNLPVLVVNPGRETYLVCE